MSEAITKALRDLVRDCMAHDFNEHWESFKAAEAALCKAGQGGQGEAVAWRHSRTLTLHETEEEVQLADADSWAEPLYLSAAHPAPVPQAAMSEAQALEIAGRVSTCVEAIREAEAFHRVPAPVASAAPMSDAQAYEIAGRVFTCVECIRETEKFHRIGQQPAPAVPAGWSIKRNADASIGIWAPDGTSAVVYKATGRNQDLWGVLAKVADALSAAPKPEQAATKRRERDECSITHDPGACPDKQEGAAP